MLDTDTHGTLCVWEELHEVGVRERVVADVVARRIGKVEEERSNTRRLILEVIVLCVPETLERHRHTDKDKAHGNRGKHEHPATAEAGDDERDGNSVDQGPALVGNIDARFGVVGCVPHHSEEKIRIVGKQRVAAHLCEKTHHYGNEHTTPHTGSAEHVHPGLLRVLEFELDGGANLGHFGLYKNRAGIAFGVVLGQNGERFIVAILTDKPTGTLRK